MVRAYVSVVTVVVDICVVCLRVVAVVVICKCGNCCGLCHYDSRVVVVYDLMSVFWQLVKVNS